MLDLDLLAHRLGVFEDYDCPLVVQYISFTLLQYFQDGLLDVSHHFVVFVLRDDQLFIFLI